MIRRTVMLGLAFLLIAESGFGQVKLDHKFIEGLTLTTEAYIEIDQTLIIAGNETKTRIENQTTTQATAGRRDADGNLPVEEKIESLQIHIGGTAGDYRFDSANPDSRGGSPLEMLREVHKAIADRTQTTVYGKENRVVDIEYDSDALSNRPPEVQSLAKSQLDPEYVRSAANQRLDCIPTEPVRQGDTWERTEQADFGAGQTMEFEPRYTYEGTVESGGRTLDKITAQATSVEFSLADDSPLPISLKESQLRIKESKSVISFDRALGRIVQSKETIRIKGELTFEANGQELPSELDLKMETELTLRR